MTISYLFTSLDRRCRVSERLSHINKRPEGHSRAIDTVKGQAAQVIVDDSGRGIDVVDGFNDDREAAERQRHRSVCGWRVWQDCQTLAENSQCGLFERRSIVRALSQREAFGESSLESKILQTCSFSFHLFSGI